jgi:V/A-type H+-transporting ATPase subunit I
MNLAMVPVEIIGLKSDLQRFLAVLRDLGCVQIESINDTQEVLARSLTVDSEWLKEQEGLTLLAARAEGLMEILGKYQRQTPPAAAASHISGVSEIAQQVERLLPTVQALIKRLSELDAELSSLPLYETTLSKLLPLVPPAAYEPDNAMIGILINRANSPVLDMVCKQVLEISQGTARVVTSDVGDSMLAMLIVIAKQYLRETEILLGQKDVSRLRLPPELGEGMPDTVLETINRRMREIPVEKKHIEDELANLANSQDCCPLIWKTVLEDELEGYQVLSQFGETDMTFVMAGWVPKRDLKRVKDRLHEEIGEAILVQELEFSEEMKARAPVILDNIAPARPYESLVRLLELPGYGRTDPTALMSLFLPIFFGLMLGDIGYGVILLVISLLLRRKFRAGFGRDLITVIAIGSGWAILFGILFGEIFGTLGEALGLHPIWMARDSVEDVQGFLLMSVAIGAGHITLGLILGVWGAIRDRSRSHLLERGGMLLGLISLFFMVGVLVDFLPSGFMTPAIAGLILGIVLLGASLGWIGILMGPIEFIGLIGNVLSYLRIAAIGLASVYLAKVANSMAGMVGNIIVGLIVAILIHALNLLMGAFSPSIHSLRLHYVEFFRKFYEGGGRPYQPFRSRLS